MKKLLEKREGFTLIELLAVIVILAVIMLVASTSVAGVMKNAKQGTFRNEFLSLLESAQIRASLDQMNGEYFAGNSGDACYSIKALTQFSKASTYNGSVLVRKVNGVFTYVGWMSNGEFMIKSWDGHLTSDQAVDYNSSDLTSINNCGSATAASGTPKTVKPVVSNMNPGISYSSAISYVEKKV